MTTQLLDTEIVYDRITKDYNILSCGIIVDSAPTYSQAENKRTKMLSERRDEGLYASSLALAGPGDDPIDDAPDQDEAPEDPQEDRCKNCGGAHHIQRCPAIWQALRDETPNPGRAIARQWHKTPRMFVGVLRQLDPVAWWPLAEAYAAWRGCSVQTTLDAWTLAAQGTQQLPERARDAA